MSFAPSPASKPLLLGAKEGLNPTPPPAQGHATLRLGAPRPGDTTFEANALEALSLPTVREAPIKRAEIPGYEILGELGRGGMGIVYRAKQEKLNRFVALKMLRHEDIADLADVVRFRSEAEAVAAVRHPNIVQVFDYGQSDGRPYFAMEYLPGGSLFNLIRAGAPLDPDLGANLLVKLARAVQAAHSQGIVHRDLKPSNVLFDANDEPKITDFGLAKRTSLELTRTQVIMGTPAYMAPEQASGRAKFAGPPADIYALGVILYECLTGKTPFLSDDPIQLIDQVIRDVPPPLRSRVPSIPRDLALICMKCLEKDPRERYATGDDLADDLERYLAREPISVRPTGLLDRGLKWARRRPTLAAAYGLALFVIFLIGFGGGVVSLWIQASQARDAADGSRRDLELALVDAERAQQEASKQKRMAESARDEESEQRRRAEGARDELNGKNVEIEGALGRETKAKAAAQSAQEELERTRYFRNVAFAHKELKDGNFVRAAALLNECAKVRRGWEWHHVYTLAHPEFGSGATGAEPFDAAFIPGTNNVQIGLVEGQFARFNFDDGKRTAIELAPLGGQVHFSIDGRRAIVLLDRHGNTPFTRVSVWDLEENRELRVWEEETETAIIWELSGDGKRCLVNFQNKPLRVFDVDSGKLVAETEAIIPDFKALSLDVRARFDASGTRAVVPTKGGLLDWDLAEAKRNRLLKIGTGIPSAAGISPDGNTRVACTNSGELYLFPGGAEKPILRAKAHRGEIGVVAFSPDGKSFATAGEDGAVRVWNAADGNPLREFNGHVGQIVGLNYNPRGNLLAAVDQSRIFRVWPVDVQFSTVSRVAFPEPYTTLFASDFSGKRYFADDGKGSAAVWDSGRAEALPIFAPEKQRFTAVAFQPNSNRYAVGTDKGGVFYRKDLDSRPVHIGILPDAIHTIRLSDDGRWLAAASENEVGVWEIATGKAIQQLGIVANPRCLAFSPDSKRLAAAGKIFSWLIPLDGSVDMRMKIRDEASCLAFTPNSKDLVVGARNWTVAVYDISHPRENGAQCKGEYIGHNAAVTSLAYHPNGERLVTGAADGTLKVWDVGSWNEAVGLSTGFRETVSACGFTPDGHHLIALTENRPPVRFEAKPGHKAFHPAWLSGEKDK